MRRTVWSTLVLDVSGHTNLVASFAAAAGAPIYTERVSFELDDIELAAREPVDVHGTGPQCPPSNR